MKTNLEKMRVTRTGRINVVSSGYSDRYALSTVHITIAIDGVTFRIDNDNGRVPAIIKLAGLEMNDENIRAAVDKIHSSEWAMFATYEASEKFGHTTGTVKTSASRISSGIHAATGYVGLNDYGKAQHEPIAATLTREEWLVVKTGLDRINKRHAELGKPVVEFTIPEDTK